MVGQDKHECIYVVDSSSWIAIAQHPAQNRILSALGVLVEIGRIKIPPEVPAELKETSPILVWIETYKDLLVENCRGDAAYLLLAGTVAHKFSGMAGARGTRTKADPWVVALAAHKSGSSPLRHVVCDETLRRRPNRKMPTACRAFGVQCLTLMQMLDREYPDDGWI